MIWNPSEGIHLGFITLRIYSLMFVLAFGIGWYLMKKIFIKENESLDKLDSLFIWTVLATLIGARLGHVFFYDWEYFRNHPAEILLPFRFEPEFEFTNAKYVVPKIGDKKHLMDLCFKNAESYKREREKQLAIIDPERHTDRIMQQMMKDLRMMAPLMKA